MNLKDRHNNRGGSKAGMFTLFKVYESGVLLDFIMKKMSGISKTSAKQIVSGHRVYVDNALVSRPDFVLAPGQVVKVFKHKARTSFSNRFLKMVYEDSEEKIKTAYSYLNEYVKEKNRGGNIYIVHRLDRDTSGLLVFAKNEYAKRRLQDCWKNIVTERKYVAVLCGEVEKDKDTVVSNLVENKAFMTYSVHTGSDEGRAVTHYRVMERFGYVTLVECILETGRTHQIRAHMRHIGHPLFGDERYGGCEILRGNRSSSYKAFITNCFKLCDRQALHARTLGFRHPLTGRQMDFDSPPPADLAALIEKWRVYISGTNNNTFENQ